jgi:flagellar basal-body rod protein FlgG
MLRSLWTAKTGLDAQQTSLDTISNNLANVSTTAYKRVRPIFEDLLYQNLRSPGLVEDSSGTNLPAGLQAGNGSRISATQRINSAGSLIQSQNPLDMAINGNGFFAVAVPNGAGSYDVAYTRAGNFMRNSDGRIVTTGGHIVLNENEVPSLGNSTIANPTGITIPSQSTAVVVGTDGSVTTYGVSTTTPIPSGRIGVSNFANPTGLATGGGGLYFETASSGNAINGVASQNGFGSISQYYTEQSNVNVAEELVSLIAAQRAYEITAKSVSASDQILQKLGQL